MSWKYAWLSFLCFPCFAVRYVAESKHCPSSVANQFVEKVRRQLEKDNSFYTLRKWISENQIDKRHFVEEYQIERDPLFRKVQVSMICPRPLMKVHVYRGPRRDRSYTSLLSYSGKLIDPTYEVFLRSEKKLKNPLPFLSIDADVFKDEILEQIASSLNHLNVSKAHLSEIVLRGGDLLLFLGSKRRPAAAYLGDKDWTRKMKRLQKIINYAHKNRRNPKVINLTDLQKVVVKF